jgi:hypothetical protein
VAARINGYEIEPSTGLPKLPFPYYVFRVGLGEHRVLNSNAQRWVNVHGIAIYRKRKRWFGYAKTKYSTRVNPIAHDPKHEILTAALELAAEIWQEFEEVEKTVKFEEEHTGFYPPRRVVKQKDE